MSDNISNDTAGTETASTEATNTDAGILDAGSSTTETTEATSTEATSNWYDGLTESVTSHKGFEGLKGKINGVDALAMSYLNLQSKLGSHEEGGLKPISADSTPEELNEFFNANGRPETPGDYKFDGLPEGMELDTEKLTERQAGLHQLGLSQSQYEGVMGMHIAEVNEIQDNLQQNQANIRAATEKSLRAEWGTDFDKNVKSVAAVAERFGVKDELISTGVINQEFVMKMLYNVSLSTSEDGIVKTKDSGYNRAEEYKNVRQQLTDMPEGTEGRYELMQKMARLSRG